MNRNMKWFSLLSGMVLVATTFGCSDNSPVSGGDAGGGGTGGHAQGGTGGTSGSGGTHGDAAGSTGGSHGSGGAPDAGGGMDSHAETASSCTGSANATACVACCDALYPDGSKQAFFGNECLYCTATCGETRICRGVTDGATKDINGPCLKCAQQTISTSSCPFASKAKCEPYIACLKQCPTN